MRVVVTGAAGFIGSHLVDALLAAGDDVVGIDSFLDYYPRELKERNLARARDHDTFRLMEGSLLEVDLARLLDGAERVFHLAAQAGVRSSWGAEFETYTNSNVLATQRLLEAAIHSGKPRVVYASSSSVYGAAADLPLREDSRCLPVSPYGVTKLAGEHLALLYARSYALPVVALRYFTAYGPRQRPDMAFHRFLRAARESTPIRVFGDGRQTRDFTFVSDVVAATLAAGERGPSGGVYNVGGGERVALNDVLKLIERTTGCRLVIEYEDAQRGDMRDTSADIQSAQRDLGFCSRVSLSDGLQAEWTWLRELA